MLRRVLVPVLVAAVLLVVLLAVCEARREPAQRELGRRLFFDPAVSRSGTVACADCHDPEHGFSDPRVLSMDEAGETARHSQPLLDLGEGPFHWDGEFASLGDLVQRRIGSLTGDRRGRRERPQARRHRALSHANADPSPQANTFVDRVEASLLSDGYYAPAVPWALQTPAARLAAKHDRGGRSIQASGLYATAFRRAFGTASVSVNRISRALEAYMRSLRSTQSRYDRFVTGDLDALTSSQRRGLELFRGRAGCAECHPLDTPARAISDGSFHNTGVAFHWRSTQARRERRKRDALLNPDLDRLIPVDPPLGRAGATGNWRDDMSFKTPNLRDVARRPPYMHDGSLAALEDVVKYYAGGGTKNHGLDPLMKRIHIEPADVQHLVAFLESLTGDVRPGLGAVEPDRPTRLEVTFRCDRGPIADTVLEIVPSGDRLAGTDVMPTPFPVRTDERGRVGFPWPRSTHVIVRHRRLAEGRSQLIPDCCSTVDLDVMSH